MDDPNITIKEYIKLEEEKAHRRGKVYKWETATYGKIRDNEDVHDLESDETEFPAIVFNYMLTSEATLLCKPTISSLNNEIYFRISFDESDDEDYTIIFNKNSFSYKMIYVDKLKMDLEICTLQIECILVVKAHVILLHSQLMVNLKNKEITEGIIQNYYDRENGDTTLRFEV
ncbi:hypothetical protein Tco_1102158 [Tanacetum coccineum]